MNSDKYDNPVYSKMVAEFITVANEFCMFIKKTGEYDKRDVFSYLQKISPLLYIKATLLPGVEISDETANERFVTEIQWQGLFNELRAKFDTDDVYTKVHNLDIYDNEPFKGSLSEDIADIYQDLEDFIRLYEKGSLAAKENAVFWCRHHFVSNWGVKLLSAQNFIHTILYRDEITERVNFENEGLI